MVYSRKYCFKHLYMIKIPLVAFNQSETCYSVKYKVLLNVAKVSVITTMPTHYGAFFLLLNLTSTHSMSPGTNKSFALTNTTKLPRVPGQRSKTVSVPDYEIRPNFIMVITQLQLQQSNSSHPKAKTRTSTLNRHGNKHETPQAPKQTTSSPLGELYLMADMMSSWHIRDPTKKPDLQSCQSFQRSENILKRGQCSGCRELRGSLDSFFSVPGSPGRSL